MILLFLVFILLSACGDGEETVTYRLTSKERRKVDTLVAAEVRILRPLMDSLCDANFADLVDEATDSIVQLRLEEELRLRNRIPLNQ